MLKYVFIENIRVPTYGLIVIMDVLLCNFIAQIQIQRNKHNPIHIFFLEFFGALGAVVGAKVLSIIDKSGDAFSINVFMKAGYSYYGGLLGFFTSCYLYAIITKIDGYKIAEDFLFLIPLLHCIWKIGCFMGGCCYGIPYDGVFSVCYEDGVNSIAGMQVFPVQILEAIISFFIMIILIILSQKSFGEPVGIYLTIYGISRFGVEFLRYHSEKTILSRGQIYSLVCECVGVLILIRYRRRISNERTWTKDF